MIDEYGCDENDFICKVNARQNPTGMQPTAQYNHQGGDGVGALEADYGRMRTTPLSQHERDLQLSDIINQNQLKSQSSFNVSPKELQGNMMGLLAGGVPLGTIGMQAANAIQGINPLTDGTFDHYSGDTNSQGKAIGPAGAHDRSLQSTYASQYEADVADMYGDGSPEHMNTISAESGDTSTVGNDGQGGFSPDMYSGGVGAGGLLGVASQSDADMYNNPNESSSGLSTGQTTGSFGGMDFTSPGLNAGGGAGEQSSGAAMGLQFLFSDVMPGLEDELGLSRGSFASLMSGT